MAADGMQAPLRARGETWFEVDGASVVAFRARGDGCNIEQSPFTIVQELASSAPIAWVDGYERHQQVFHNAVAIAPDRHRFELGEAIGQIAALYAFGLTLPEDAMVRLESTLKHLDRDEVEALTQDDLWIRNFVLNVWEFATGATELTTYPWNISLPIADLCNARCTFCTSWIEGKALVKLKQIESFKEVLKNAVQIGLVGHGEPLAHPQFDKICDEIAKHVDPRVNAYTITNGVYLKKWAEKIDAIHLKSFSISLNAATAKTHHEVMGLGEEAFPEIIDAIRDLCRPLPDGSKRNVYITLVTTQQNIAEIPAFIKLGEDLGVTQVWIRSLLPVTDLMPGLNYHTLPPSLHPDFERLKQEALEAIARAKVTVVADPSTWDTPIFSPDVLAKIEQAPPPFITREQALKDRDLRSRNADLYDRSSHIQRGLPVDTPMTRVRYFGDSLELTTQRTPWSPAVSLPIDLPHVGDEEGRVSVRAFAVEGNLGIGLLDKDTNTWITRGFLEADGEVELAFTGAARSVTLLLENASETGSPTKARVERARIHARGVTSAAPSYSRGAIHNPEDPYEDGLNPMDRTPRFECKAVYYNLYINEMYFRIVPCCYMTTVPGFQDIRFDGDEPFLKNWNSPAMVALRERLKHGPLFAACRKCAAKW